MCIVTDSARTKAKCQFCNTQYGKIYAYKMDFPALSGGENKPKDHEIKSFVICDQCLYSRVTGVKTKISKWVRNRYL